MIQNVNPQQFYILPNTAEGQACVPQRPVPCVAPSPMVQQGTMPVYSNIPYNPVYGHMGQHSKAQKCMPDLSTVKIELNGLEPPKMPGYNDGLAQSMPIYPGMAQMLPTAAQFSPYQTLPQPTPPIAQPQPMSVQPQPQSEIIPPPPVINQTQKPEEAVTPQQPAKESTAPAINQTQKPEGASAGKQQEEEAVKPLLESLNIISSGQEGAAPNIDQQKKALMTIAQFAKVADASNQMVKASPDNPDIKQAKEKADSLIKPNLIKEETFLGLANIAVQDTSSLTPEDKQKADENRKISMWTLSMLQKLFKQETNEEAKRVNVAPISMGEIPGISQVVNIVKKDANPDIREAGIAALVNLADPQDKKDFETMKIILGEVQNDKADNVKKTALEALKLYS